MSELNQTLESASSKFLIADEAGSSPSKKDAEFSIIDNTVADNPPDGGFTAWATVFASFIVHFLALGTLYSFGIYATEYYSAGLGSLTVISFIGSISAACLVAFGILSGRLAETFGFRPMIFIGVCISSLGLIIASFCTNSAWKLMLTQGFLFGIGSSMSYFPAVSVPSQWFNKKRSIATGVAVSGSGIGGLAMSQIIQALINKFDVPWTLRIIAIINFIGITTVLPFMKTRIPASRGSKTDWSVIKDQRFQLIIFIVFFATFPTFIPIIYLPVFATKNVGVSATLATSLVSVYNGASAVGRVVVGVLADTVLGRVNSIVFCGIVSGSSMLFIWTFADTYALLVFFAAVNGFVAGGFISLFPVVVGQTFGLKRLPSLVGMILTLSAIGNLAGSPLGGVIEASLGLTGVTVFAGLVTYVSVAFALILRYKLEPNMFKVF
ncbi:hypothetical protein HK100_011594 [Physocladia obscura]|uniref:Major facilitator superfamily (MFS) profile domain-containing protein n=1 Tax=Physocladia obscura TaxID=109957 RepID=A0AAD5T700_9FUNG|nr:hypothetical protein HK100_011594 [Physocladia obscura]